MSSSLADISAAIQIFAKYVKVKKAYLDAEHDKIWAIENKLVTDREDRSALEKLGWHVDEEYDCWTLLI